MDYRFVGGTGVRVSRLAFGTMSFGGDADTQTSRAMYRACREHGINLFDTADVYNGGESEEILGDLIAKERDEIVLATKAYFPTGSGPNARGSSRFHLVRAVEASLERLKTDRIDLFYLHRFDERTDLDETLRALDDLVSAGKILYPALSNFSAWESMKALERARAAGWARPTAIQPMYNVVKRQAEVELLPMAQSESMGVFPYSPLGGGLLSGKYRGSQRPDSGRLVDNTMYKTRYGGDAPYDIAAAFCAWCDERSVHPVTAAVAWVESHPAVTAPLLGARNLEQLKPALAASEWVMDADARAQVSALSPEPPPATDRNEERTADNYGAR